MEYELKDDRMDRGVALCGRAPKPVQPIYSVACAVSPTKQAYIGPFRIIYYKELIKNNNNLISITIPNRQSHQNSNVAHDCDVVLILPSISSQ